MKNRLQSLCRRLVKVPLHSLLGPVPQEKKRTSEFGKGAIFKFIFKIVDLTRSNTYIYFCVLGTLKEPDF